MVSDFENKNTSVVLNFKPPVAQSITGFMWRLFYISCLKILKFKVLFPISVCMNPFER